MDARANIPIRQAEDVSLREVLQTLWRARWFALSFSAVLVCGAIVAALVLPKQYEVSILVAPVDREPGASQLGSLGSMMSNLGGLASLAGISVGTSSRRAEIIAVLQSRALTENYIQDHNLLPVLFAPLWDAKTGRWKTNDPQQIPNLWTANEYFKHHVRTITEDPKTGLVTLKITWTNPQVAADWANGLVRATNDYLRAQAISESDRSIAYLEQQSARIDVVGVKQAINTVLQNELDKETLAQGTEQYALKVLDPAAPPARPSSPKPVMWALLALFTGLLLSLFAAFVKVAWAEA